MSRAHAVFAVGLSAFGALAALAGCGGEGPEDPAATPGAGIPMGAIGASGVGFEGASTRADASVVKGKIRPRAGKTAPAPEALPTPPDPFADPPTADDPPRAPAPKDGHRRPPRRPEPSRETTL